MAGGPNQPMLQKLVDELWIAAKNQSNSEIAGSPRNSFRASLVLIVSGGRALFRLGDEISLPNLDKLRILS